MKYKTLIILTLAALFTGILYLSSPRADEPAPRPQIKIKDPNFNESYPYNNPDDELQLAYDERARVMAFETRNSQIKFFNTKTGAFLGEREGSSPRFTPDGMKIIYAASSLHIVNPVNLAEIKNLPVHNPMAISHDGKLIVSMRNEISMEMVDFNSGEVLSGCTVGWNCGIVAAVFTDNKHALVAAGNNICEGPRLFDLNECKELGYVHVDDNPEPSVSVYFSPDAKFMITSNGSDSVDIYNLPSLKKFNSIEIQKGTDLGRIVFSPDSKKFAFTIYDYRKDVEWVIQTREFPTGKPIKEIRLAENESANMDPRFKFLAGRTWGKDPEVSLRSVRDGHLLCKVFFRNHEWIVTTPEGFFDASEGAKDFITWQVGNETYPAEKFWKDFYRPGILAEAIKDKGPVK